MAANGNPPIPEIAEERIRIAETAERKKWAGADFVGGEQGDLSAKPAKPKQSSGCGENRILVELPDCLERSRCCFGAGKNNQVCAAHGRKWFPELASWQQRLPCKRPRNIHQKYIQVAGKLQVLKTVIQNKNIDGLLGFDSMAPGKAVLANAENDLALEAELHQFDFVAGPVCATVAPAQNRHALPFCKKLLSEPDNHGRFAGAADGKIAHADNRSFQTLLLQPGVRIEPNPHPHNCPVHDR